MTKKPNYRLVGYTESWEERKFGQLIRSIQTGTTLLGNEQNNGIPLLKMGNIQRGYWDLTKIERLEQEIESENIIRYGDFIFNTRNTLELVGKGATWVLKNGIYGFNSNLARVIFDGVDTIFFNYLYNIPNSISQVKARAVGTTSVAAVYPRDLYSINFALPSLPEQTVIGSFFQDIDQLISLQQRKLEVLKEQKKTYLKLLFPAKGQTKPALRFAGFEDDWKEVKLGGVCSIKGGNAWKSEHYSTDGKYLVVTISNVKGNEYIDDTYGNRIDTVESQFILEQGDILISLTGNVGRVSKMTEVAAVLNQRVGKLTTNQSNNFLFTLLSNRNFEKEMVLSSQGAAQVNISNNDVLNYKTSFPSLPEQEAIGSFFQDLDKAIAKQEEKVNQLKESKQTLLRKMFI